MFSFLSAQPAKKMFSSSYDATFWLMVAVTLFMYAMSVIHRNYSWVDRSWSIMPVVYTWIHIFYKFRDASSSSSSRSGFAVINNTAVMYGVLVTLWGIRLTFNFARRGGYSRGSEDYRWNYVRGLKALKHPVVWEIYSFTNIALFQTALLWGLALPMMNIPVAQIGAKDKLVGFFFLLFVLFETICDEQQQRFQRAKRLPQGRQGKNASGEDKSLSYGFCVTGVFGYSRHLNVFCEGCVWVTLALASTVHGGFVWWQWFGCITLGALVTFSTACITEKLSREKYPLYAVYQQTTPMLLPTIRSTTSRTLYLLEQSSNKKH